MRTPNDIWLQGQQKPDWKQRLLFLAFALLSLFFIGLSISKNGHALDFCELPEGFEEMARDQMEWIAERTQYVYSRQHTPLPGYVCGTEHELRLVRGARQYAELVALGVEILPLAAIYDHVSETMFINTEKLTVGSPEFWATHAHEGVHHLQNRNGKFRTAPCFAALEPEAYAVGDKWFEKTGHGYKSDPLTVMLIAACGGGH